MLTLQIFANHQTQKLKLRFQQLVPVTQGDTREADYLYGGSTLLKNVGINKSADWKLSCA